jgi:UDP-N-acetylmuramate--L-alanine ligase
VARDGSALTSPVHLVGMAGDGMAALAQYLLDLGLEVSGSDLRTTPELVALAAQGVRVYRGHVAAQCPRVGTVVVSDAVPSTNIELAEARIRDLPILRRAECIGRLARTKRSIFVAGAHGKSTTTAMIARVLESAGQAPSFIAGAPIPSLSDRRARCQPGALLVCEACEAFNNLTPLYPDLAVVTNIDDDHLEHYGSQARIDAAFRAFVLRTAPDGAIVANGDDPGVARALADLDRPLLAFGFEPGASVRATGFRHEHGCARVDVTIDGRRAGDIALGIPGRHSALNALACLTVCLRLGLTFDQVARGLAEFTGVARRWQDHGLVGGVRLVDDYAHHPTELATAIETARALRGEGQRLVVAFQPQLYSRTRRLHDDFARVLAGADLTLLLEIDPAGEAGREPVSSARIADGLRRRGAAFLAFDDGADLVARASQVVRPGDFLLLAGSGSIRNAAADLRLALLRATTAASARTEPSRTLPGLPAVDTPTSEMFQDDESSQTALALFLRWVRERPDAAAVSGPHSSLTFAQLDAASAALAHDLAQRGARRGSAVGVQLPSSVDLVVAMIALARLGAVYVPIDSGVPQERAAFMLAQVGADLLITSPGSPLDLESIQAARIYVAAHASEAAPPGSTMPIACRPTDTAYICFTSGSTGRPKGVAVAHRSLFLLVADNVGRFDVGPGQRALLNTSIGFDVSLGEIWTSLCGGAELCVTGAARPLVGDRLADALAARAITHLAVTPSVLGSVTSRPLPALTHIVCAGEACPSHLVAQWAPGRRFFNAYGPTEATIYATVAECRAGEAVTIGHALPHVEAHILDEHLVPVTDGVEGELCLAGPALAIGYVGEEASTDRFCVLSGTTDAPPRRIYRTGDLVRRGPAGAIAFIGRRDNQVKLLGSRVELGEIEQTARRLEGIVDAAVVLAESGGVRELVCFVTLTKGTRFDADTLRARLATWLPAHMLPGRLIEIPSLPLTASGKLDRRQLVELAAQGVVRRSWFSKARTDVEARLLAIWKEILALPDDIGVYDEFESLGGDSLKSLMLIAEIEQQFSITIPPGHLGRITNVMNLAIQVEELIWNARPPDAAPAPGFRGTRIYQQLRHLTASWAGTRIVDDGLIVSAGDPDPRFELFVCLQTEHELQQLARRMGRGYRIHAMRSGHLVMHYSPENTRALAAHYLEEMAAFTPKGPVVIGGVCQGGAIAFAVAHALADAGTPTPLLVLVEQSRLTAFDGALAFFYSRSSYLNPHTRFDTGTARYLEAYGDRFTLDIIEGGHGEFANEPYVREFAATLKARIHDACGTTPDRGIAAWSARLGEALDQLRRSALSRR